MWIAIMVLLTIGCLLFIVAGAFSVYAAVMVSRFLDREFARADEQIEKGQRKLFDSIVLNSHEHCAGCGVELDAPN